MRNALVTWLIATVFLGGCAAIAPLDAPQTSTPLGSVPPATSTPADSSAGTAAPLETTAETLPAPSEPALPSRPPKTPKPTRPPTPTPNPTPTPTPVDLEVFIYGSDLPNPWYVDTAYTIPVYVTTTGADIPNAHVKVTIENLTAEWDTGFIATTDTYFHNVEFRLTATGRTMFTMAVKAPRGYRDTDRSNNKGGIEVDVQPKP